MFRLKIYTLLALFPLTIGLANNTSDYLWPIKADASLSATFCEPRDGHLHAGVDIKTWGEMEVPCQAVADGFIERVLVRYQGYGRALFVRLNDGNLAVYGHLERFTPELEKLVRKQQKTQSSYQVKLNFEPGDLPVKRGSVLAYTGTSGTEHPHLHFEIRTGDKQILNPLKLLNFSGDNRAPVITELLFEPAADDARVNGSLRPQVFNADEHPAITLMGPTILHVNTHDKINGTYNRYAPYEILAKLDDDELYHLRFDGGPQAAVDRPGMVYSGARGSDGWWFTRLHQVPARTPIVYSNSNLSGILSEYSGLRTLSLSVADFQENTKVQSWPLEFQTREEFFVVERDQVLTVIRSHTKGDYQDRFFYDATGKQLKPSLIEYRLDETRWQIPGNELANGLLVDSSSDTLTHPRCLIPPQDSPMAEVSADWVPVRSGWILNLVADTVFTPPLTYRLKTISGVHLGTLHAISDTVIETELLNVVQRSTAEWLALDLPGGREIRIEFEPLHQVGSARPLVLATADGQFTVLASKVGTGKAFLEIDSTSITGPQGLVTALMVNVVRENPDIEISLEVRSTRTPEMTQPAFYRRGSRNRWYQLATAEKAGLLTTRIDRSGTYAVLEDLLPPTIDWLNRKANYRKGERVVFRISDDFGKLGQPDSALVTTLDGDRFFADWNSLRGELSFHIPSEISRGEHRLYLEARDAQGNMQQVSATLRVR